MVWGRPGPATESATHHQISPSRLRAVFGLLAVATVTAGLEAVVGLGPTWPVVAAAALGTGAVFALARVSVRVVVAAVVLVAAGGLAWIEAVNLAQYGTLSLSGPPPLVRWCGTTYRPDGIAATAPGPEATPPYAQVLRTPSGHDVYGVAPTVSHPCPAGGALFMEDHPGRWLVYGPAP